MGSSLNVIQVVSAPVHVEGQKAGITGPERRAANLARLWAENEVNVTVLYSRRGTLWDTFAATGIPILEFDLYSKFDFSAIGRLENAICASRARVIHTQGPGALDMMAVAAACRCNIASIVTRPVLIDDLTNRSKVSRWIYSAVDRLYTVPRCDALVAVSKAGYRRMADYVAKDRLHLIQNGAADRGAELERLPCDGMVHLGMIGHLRRYKGVDDFLAVARLLCADRDNLHFHIVGEGPERASLERMRDDFGLNDKVTFHGLLHDIAPVLKRLDIFLFTSWREGLSVAVLEAMSASLPIVATDIGGIADQIEPGENGFIEPAHDVQSLAGRCRELINDEKKRHRMGIVSRRYFEERFAQTRMLSNYVALYKSVSGEQ